MQRHRMRGNRPAALLRDSTDQLDPFVHPLFTRERDERLGERAATADDEPCIAQLAHRANEELEALVVDVSAEGEYEKAAAVPAAQLVGEGRALHEPGIVDAEGDHAHLFPRGPLRQLPGGAVVGRGRKDDGIGRAQQPLEKRLV